MKWTDALAAWSSFGSAIVALLALVAAAFAATVAWRASRAQTEHLEGLEIAEQERLAAGFGVWLGEVDGNGEPRRLYYYNAGPLPVYEVRLHIRIVGEDMEYLSLGDLGPTVNAQFLERATSQVHVALVDRAGPEIERAHDYLNSLDLDDYRIAGIVSTMHEVEIVGILFKDGDGTSWFRTNGILLQASIVDYATWRKYMDRQ